VAGRKTGPHHSGELAAANSGRRPQWIANHIGMIEKRLLDRGPLAAKAVPIDASARARKSRPASEQCARERGGGRGIANAHFSEHDEIHILADDRVSGPDRGEKISLAHGGRSGEIGGRPFEFKWHHTELRTRELRKLIDRRTARGKIGDHLYGHFGRKRRNPLASDTVISGEDENFALLERGRIASLPGRKPAREVFQAPKASLGLGQLGLAGAGRIGHSRIGAGKIEASGAQVIERDEIGHFSVGSKVQRGGTRDITGMGGIITDLRVGLAFCTRLPISSPDGVRLADAAWTLPVAGGVVGAAGALVYCAATGLDLPPVVSATLAIATTAIVTGCLHEDGLGDTADGFGGGRSPARVLEIMRDSRIGTYGVIALILSFALRIGALASLPSAGLAALTLIGANAGARGALPVFMRAVPQAREDGLSAGAGIPSQGSAASAAIIGLLALLLCLGLGASLWTLFLTTAALLLLARLACKTAGGQTGDVLGTAEQTVEILTLLVVASLW